MHDYDDMSDFELNKAAAIALGYDTKTHGKKVLRGLPSGEWFTEYNPCGDRSDALQLMTRNGISLLHSPESPFDDYWVATTNPRAILDGGAFSVWGESKNMCRAITIAFLKLKGVEVKNA